MAQAQTVIYDPDLPAPAKAIGIANFSFGGQLWNVSFTEVADATEVFGTFPGDFTPFECNSDGARDVVDAMDLVLNENGVLGVHIYPALDRAYDKEKLVKV